MCWSSSPDGGRQRDRLPAGASGCGKTTLLKAIAGLLPLAEGTIRLGDTLLDGPGASVPPGRATSA